MQCKILNHHVLLEYLCNFKTRILKIGYATSRLCQIPLWQYPKTKKHVFQFSTSSPCQLNAWTKKKCTKLRIYPDTITKEKSSSIGSKIDKTTSCCEDENMTIRSVFYARATTIGSHKIWKHICLFGAISVLPCYRHSTEKLLQSVSPAASLNRSKQYGRCCICKKVVQHVQFANDASILARVLLLSFLFALDTIHEIGKKNESTSKRVWRVQHTRAPKRIGAIQCEVFYLYMYFFFFLSLSLVSPFSTATMVAGKWSSHRFGR